MIALTTSTRLKASRDLIQCVSLQSTQFQRGAECIHRLKAADFIQWREAVAARGCSA